MHDKFSISYKQQYLQAPEVEGNPDEDLFVGEHGTVVEVKFNRTDKDLPVSVGRTTAIVCAKLGKLMPTFTNGIP